MGHEDRLEVMPLRTGVLSSGCDLPGALAQAWGEAGESPVAGDVLVVASKAVAIWQGRVVDLSTVEPSHLAREMASRTGMLAEFCQVVIDGADRVLGAVPGAMLTLVDGVLVANSGADMSNAPPGTALLWPEDPWGAARRLASAIHEAGAGGVGVVVADSHVQPLRYGTVGMALGWSGIEGVEDVRGHRDLYGRTLNVTKRNVADMLASLGTLVMGESDASTPATLVRGLGVAPPPEGEQGPADVLVPPELCLFHPVYQGSLLDRDLDDAGDGGS
jgi:coenzyme F420-0:L-glutamate ligase